MTTPTTVQARFQLRADTAANWASVNPVLLSNEFGLETDTKKLKVGDGSTAWNSLGYFPSIVSGGTVLGNLEIGTTGSLTFEGSTADGFETTLAVTNPTADRTITLPDQSGTVVVTGNASIVNADIAANAEIAVSKLANGTANQVLVTDGTDVSWSDDLTLAGNLTVNGTTTTVNTETLTVKDKNIELAVVDTPTDTTADGGGITLKGSTDKTINWIDATDAWTSSERFSYPLGSAAAPALTFTGDENTGIYSPGADQLGLATNGTGRLFVDSSGRVGVNTASPATLLHLSDDTALFIRLQRTGGSPSVCSVANSGNLLYLSSDGSGIQFNTGATPTEAARIDSSGRLLIGTSSARASTNFKDGGYTTPLQIEGAADNTSFGPTFVANTGTTNPTFRGAIATLARTRGTSIGSNTSVSSGDLLGTLQFSGADGTNLVPAASITAYVDTTPGTDDMPGRLVFFTTADGASSPTERMVLNSNGALLVQGVYDGTTADAANVNVTSNGSMRRSTSSIKYKTDVETIENQYADAVLQCRPVWYRSTCEGDCPEHSWWGFIAEEVAKIDPRLVHWKATESVIQEDGSRIEVPCDPEPEGVQYDRFVPHLLNLIKRQGEAITDLQAKVANLEGGAN